MRVLLWAKRDNPGKTWENLAKPGRTGVLQFVLFLPELNGEGQTQRAAYFMSFRYLVPESAILMYFCDNLSVTQGVTLNSPRMGLRFSNEITF